MEAAEELMRSVELSHELSDTRVSAFFTLGKVFWKDLARRLEDGDEEKSDMYEKGVRAFKVNSFSSGSHQSSLTFTSSIHRNANHP